MSFKRHHDINETIVELDFDNPEASIIVIECLYVLFHVCDNAHTTTITFPFILFWIWAVHIKHLDYM